MKKFVVGQKVRYLNAEKHAETPKYFPEPGTIGDVFIVSDEVCMIQWPHGSTSGNDCWFADVEDLSDDLYSGSERFRMIRRYESAVEAINRVNMIHGRNITVEWNIWNPKQVYIKEWNTEKQDFSVYQSFWCMNPIDVLDRASRWIAETFGYKNRCGSHVYYLRSSYRSPSLTTVERVTTRSVIKAAKEACSTAEIVELISLHGRVLDIAKRQPDGSYKRLK